MRQSLPSELILVEQVTVYQILQKLVTIQFADHASGIIVICDISGILSQQITHNLIDGIIALFVQSIEHASQNTSHVLLIIAGYCKLNYIPISLLCKGFKNKILVTINAAPHRVFQTAPSKPWTRPAQNPHLSECGHQHAAP